jgi:hypothetical protein
MSDLRTIDWILPEQLSLVAINIHFGAVVL